MKVYQEIDMAANVDGKCRLRQRDYTPRATFLIVFIALAARCVPLVQSWSMPPEADALEYEQLAWQLSQGRGFSSTTEQPILLASPGQPTAFRTPGLPFYAGIFYSLFGRQPGLVKLSLVLLNAISAGALFSLAAVQFNSRIGWVAGLTWALWPSSILTYFNSSTLLQESIAVPFLILACWFIRGHCGHFSVIASGLLLGYSFLARSHLVLMVPIALGLAFANRSRAKSEFHRLASVLLIASSVSGLWIVRNYVSFHCFIPFSTQAGINLWLGNSSATRGCWDGNWLSSQQLKSVLKKWPELPHVSEPQKSNIFRQAAVEEIHAGGLSRFIWLEFRKVLLFFYPVEITYGWLPWLVPVLLGVFPGMLLAHRSDPSPATALLGSIFLSTLMTTMIFSHDSRFRYCGEAAAIFFASIAVIRAYDWYVTQRKAPPLIQD